MRVELISYESRRIRPRHLSSSEGKEVTVKKKHTGLKCELRQQSEGNYLTCGTVIPGRNSLPFSVSAFGDWGRRGTEVFPSCQKKRRSQI